jgi:hypothetical protein
MSTAKDAATDATTEGTSPPPSSDVTKAADAQAAAA